MIIINYINNKIYRFAGMMVKDNRWLHKIIISAKFE